MSCDKLLKLQCLLVGDLNGDVCDPPKAMQPCLVPSFVGLIGCTCTGPQLHEFPYQYFSKKCFLLSLWFYHIVCRHDNTWILDRLRIDRLCQHPFVYRYIMHSSESYLHGWCWKMAKFHLSTLNGELHQRHNESITFFVERNQLSYHKRFH